jgi:hypothetical protein
MLIPLVIENFHAFFSCRAHLGTTKLRAQRRACLSLTIHPIKGGASAGVPRFPQCVLALLVDRILYCSLAQPHAPLHPSVSQFAPASFYLYRYPFHSRHMFRPISSSSRKVTALITFLMTCFRRASLPLSCTSA